MVVKMLRLCRRWRGCEQEGFAMCQGKENLQQPTSTIGTIEKATRHYCLGCIGLHAMSEQEDSPGAVPVLIGGGGAVLGHGKPSEHLQTASCNSLQRKAEDTVWPESHCFCLLQPGSRVWSQTSSGTGPVVESVSDRGAKQLDRRRSASFGRALLFSADYHFNPGRSVAVAWS